MPTTRGPICRPSGAPDWHISQKTASRKPEPLPTSKIRPFFEMRSARCSIASACLPNARAVVSSVRPSLNERGCGFERTCAAPKSWPRDRWACERFESVPFQAQKRRQDALRRVLIGRLVGRDVVLAVDPAHRVGHPRRPDQAVRLEIRNQLQRKTRIQDWSSAPDPDPLSSKLVEPSRPAISQSRPAELSEGLGHAPRHWSALSTARPSQTVECVAEV